MEPDLFHEGEVALQRRAGVYERIAPRAAAMIRDHMPDSHRELFEKIPSLLVGSVDADGQPWASILVAAPGFVQAPDPRHLVVRAQPLPGDPLQQGLAVGRPLGLLALEPQTRRRNRMNGTVVERGELGFTVRVDQSFGNCPKYIQARTPRWADAAAAVVRPQLSTGVLAGPARALVERADTLFVASAAPYAAGAGGERGADVSHRGGRPGFVRVEQHDRTSVLTIPDYRGNFLFNTLGNIALDPRAGLLFVDHERGDFLQLGGRAEIVWEGERLRGFAGTQRLLVVTVGTALWWPQALPLRWSQAEFAPELAGAGPR